MNDPYQIFIRKEGPEGPLFYDSEVPQSRGMTEAMNAGVHASWANPGRPVEVHQHGQVVQFRIGLPAVFHFRSTAAR